MSKGDKYADYEELRRHEREGINYRKCLTDRSSPVVIVAPHGGTIDLIPLNSHWQSRGCLFCLSLRGAPAR